MATTEHAASPQQIRPYGKLRTGGKPPGTRSLTLHFPDDQYYHVEAQAALSGMHIQEYAGRFLVEEGFPLPRSSRTST